MVSVGSNLYQMSRTQQGGSLYYRKAMHSAITVYSLANADWSNYRHSNRFHTR